MVSRLPSRGSSMVEIPRVPISPVLEFEIAKDMLVVPAGSYKGYELDAARQFLSLEEIDECRAAEHYLEARQVLRDEISISVRMNSFLARLVDHTTDQDAPHTPIRRSRRG